MRPRKASPNSLIAVPSAVRRAVVGTSTTKTAEESRPAQLVNFGRTSPPAVREQELGGRGPRRLQLRARPDQVASEGDFGQNSTSSDPLLTCIHSSSADNRFVNGDRKELLIGD